MTPNYAHPLAAAVRVLLEDLPAPDDRTDDDRASLERRLEAVELVELCTPGIAPDWYGDAVLLIEARDGLPVDRFGRLDVPALADQLAALAARYPGLGTPRPKPRTPAPLRRDRHRWQPTALPLSRPSRGR